MQCLLCQRMLRPHFSFKELFLPIELSISRICPACQDSFSPSRASNPCPSCHRPLTSSQVICPDCQYWQDLLGWLLPNHSLYRYNAGMKEFMHRYKFQGDYRLREVFDDEFSRMVKQRAKSGLIVPIPVTTTNMQRRGFNQVTGLLNIPYQNLLASRQTDKAVPQSSKGRQARLQTPQPFKLLPEAVAKISGQKVLLVDDIYTTGRTLYHAATLMKKAGATRVEAVTLAH